MSSLDPDIKKKLVDPLYTAGRGYWIFLGILLITIGWGMYMYILQITRGLVVTGMQRPVYWGIYVVNFVFFIGISHAGTLISAILRVVGAEWRRPITRVAEAITTFALLVGSLQIIIDMGRPDRLLSVILHGRLQSPIVWDMVSVTAYLLGSVTYLYLPIIPDAAILRDNLPPGAPVWRKLLYKLLSLGWRGNRTQWLRLEKAISVMAVLIIPIAVSVHTIISWILATTLQPGWHSTIFGPYFVVGAIFSGIGALFVAMTVVRRLSGLEDYIAQRQYRNLGLIFITMSAVWMYFTYSEHLILAAGQEVNEFPVLASKLWGRFAPGFWAMVIAMVIAFVLLVVPPLLPRGIKKVSLFQPRPALGSAAAAGLAMLLVSTEITPPFLSTDTDLLIWRSLLWSLIIANLALVSLVILAWLKDRMVTATTLAAVMVVIGMWLERWNIVVPTMTHPYFVAWAEYRPSLTEISITAASVALFLLFFAVFFKLFPLVSIWEIMEGRAIEEAKSKVSIPLPESKTKKRAPWEWRLRR